jgi:hypothetical protein
MHSQWYLQFFSEEAKLRHATSKWDVKTRSAYSAEEAELDGFLAEDDEMNKTDDALNYRAQSTPSIAIHRPQVSNLGEFPSMYKDSDSVSTFNTKRANSVHTSTVFTPKVLDLSNDTPNEEPPDKISASIVHQDSDAVSKFSDAESRLSTLEVQFEAFSCSINELKRQEQKEAKRQDKKLASILALLQNEGSSKHPNIPPSTGPTGPADKDNPLTQLHEAGGRETETAGHGS